MENPNTPTRPGTPPEPAADGIRDCLDCCAGDERDCRVWLAWLTDGGNVAGSVQERLFELAAFEAAEDGRDAAGWIEQDSWGGRIAKASQARENAAAFLKAEEDGDPLLYSDGLLDTPGDWLTGEAYVLSRGFGCLSQRMDRLRAALDKLGLLDDVRDLGERIDDVRREAYQDALVGELVRSARAVVESEGNR